jgi:hypothetical protein
MDIKEQTCHAVDLLTDENLTFTLKRDGVVTVALKPRGAVVFKLS